MKVLDKKNTIAIDDEDLNDAKLSSADFEDETTRKRAFINVLGARMGMKYLFSKKIEANNIYSLYTIHNVLENIDIADIYINSMKIDVRLVFNRDEIFIPKSHFNCDLLPDLYMVLQLDEDFSSTEFLGFFKSEDIDRSKANKDFYFIDSDKLTVPKAIKTYMKEYGTVKHEEISAENFEKAQYLFLAMVDDEISKYDQQFLFKQLSKSLSLREKVVEFENFEIIAKRAAKDESLVGDGVLGVIGAQNIYEEEDVPQSKAEVKAEVIEEVLTDLLLESEISDTKTGEDDEENEGDFLTELSEDPVNNPNDEKGISLQKNDEDNKNANANGLSAGIAVAGAAAIAGGIAGAAAGAVVTSIAEENNIVNNVVSKSIDLAGEAIKQSASLAGNTLSELPEKDFVEPLEGKAETLEELSINTEPLEELSEKSYAESLNENIETLDEISTNEEPLMELSEKSYLEPLEEKTETIEDISQNIPLQEKTELAGEVSSSEDSEFDFLENLYSESQQQNGEDEQETAAVLQMEANNDIKLDILPQEELKAVQDNLQEMEMDSLPELPPLEEIQLEELEVFEEVKEEAPKASSFDFSSLNVVESEDIANESVVASDINSANITDIESLDADVDEQAFDDSVFDELNDITDTADEPIIDNIKLDESNESFADNIFDTADIPEETAEQEEVMPKVSSGVSFDENNEISSLIASENIKTEEKVIPQIEENDIPKKSANTEDKDLLKVLFKEQQLEETSKDNNLKELEDAVEETANEVKYTRISLQDKKMVIAASVAGVVVISLAVGISAYKGHKNDLSANLNQPVTAENVVPNNQTNPNDMPVNNLGDTGAVGQNPQVQQQTGQDTINPNASANTDNQQLGNKDMNQSVSDAFSSEPVNATISKVAWEIPENLAYNDGIRRYLQTAGKNIKLNLQNNLLLANDMAYSSKVVVELSINNTGALQSQSITVSSGSKQIDNIVLQSVKQTLMYLKMPASELGSNSVNATLIINF